ncbi:ATP-binding protein [Azospirillum griseum]|uniref:histidine kinase n=1 Tax=Azospirillum griseum TaxID=2496639 RepID=A0A431V9W3_9PROT|nr:ATP-binding protein [Azospirillum griseum]RTR12484.1 hypothetical protein EJ903_25340 [Azospirillum griseum]
MTTEPHFEISAAVVRQLGDELVSDEVTAIVELVKNAYDADASYAHVVVDTKAALPEGQTLFPGVKGYITIDDDGIGMDRSDIERGWLYISLSHKRAKKAKGETTIKGRTPLGDKGLGRLSSQKLGDNLEIITRKDGDATSLHVAFSWNAFTDETTLTSVPVTIAPAATQRKKGTRLVISGLRNPDVWRGAELEKLANDLSQIIAPFPDARPFIVTLKIDGRTIDLGEISSQIRSAAVARYTVDYKNGQLDLAGRIRLSKFRGNLSGGELEFFEKNVLASRGRDFYAYLNERKPVCPMRYSDDPGYFIEFNFSVEIKSLGEIAMIVGPDGTRIAADPGPFHCEIDEFSLRVGEEAVQLSGLANATEVKQAIKLHAGVKVFRDGFAVIPYGINGEDWLRLGTQQTSATSYYGLRPANVVGFVKISEAENSQLKDKTDRQGFIANAHSRNFNRLMTTATEKIADFLEWIRRCFNTYKVDRLSRGVPFADGQTQITKAREVSRALANYSQRANKLNSSASQIHRRVAEVTKRIKEEPIFATAAERRLEPLLNEAREALEASQALFAELQKYSADAKSLEAYVATLAPRLDVLKSQLDDFAELAGLGMHAEMLSHEAHNQTDKILLQAKTAAEKARRAEPENKPLLLFSLDVTSSSMALRRQINHLTPSLRLQRDRIEIFPIAELIDSARRYFEERWIGTSMTFVVDATNSFKVATHRGRLLQVVDNIIINSEYWLKSAILSDKPPTVHVQIDIPCLRIWDNGPGVDTAVEENLFEPFVTLKPKHIGRGLGLFISSQIASSMGCELTLRYDRNDAGRRYIFELDLASITHAEQ